MARVAPGGADAARLVRPDANFNGVVLHLALAVVPDPVAAIHAAARVLRPGGHVAVFDKFLPDSARPSPGRRLAAGVARSVARAEREAARASVA